MACHVAAARGVDHTRNQLWIAEQIPALQGQVFQSAGVHGLGLIGARQLYLRRVRRDRYRFRQTANLENRLTHVVDFLHGHLNAVHGFSLEAGCFDRQAVGARIQFDEPVRADVVRGCLMDRAGTGVSQSDLCARNSRVRRIDNGSHHGAGYRLPKYAGATEGQSKNKANKVSNSHGRNATTGCHRCQPSGWGNPGRTVPALAKVSTPIRPAVT